MAPKERSPAKTTGQPTAHTTGQAEIRIGDSVIRYQVIRSPRRKKTIEITLDPQMGVKVAAPLRASDARIQEVVRQRAAWIAKTTAIMQAARPQPRRFQTGELLPFLGRDLLLRVYLGMDRASQVLLRQGRLDLTVPHGSPDPSTAVEVALAEWYRGRALERLTAAVR